MRKRSKEPRDPFAVKKSEPKGTPMTIRVSPKIVDMLDLYRSDMAQRYGEVITRAKMLENLLNQVWREKFLEAGAMELGARLSDKIGAGDDS